MSRFVRASKYRHVFGQTARKEHGYDNVKVTNSAWDTNVVSASGRYISVNWNSSGGGAFVVLPLPSPFSPNGTSVPYKLPDVIPLARSHTASVLDTDWSPHNDSIVASGGEDGKVMIWKIDGSVFDGWDADGWTPTDFEPVARLDASPRKIGQVLFHPTASNVLASASGEHTVKLWDLSNPEEAQVTLSGHSDTVQSLAFSPSGTLLATTARDRKLRLFDPRVSGEAVHVVDGHGGIKGARIAWMGDTGRIATTGFSKMSERQIGLWDVGGGLSNIKTTVIDQSAGVLMPFWSDNNILFIAGKGDGNIRYYEYESDSLYPLSEHKSSDPQRGMCFLPRRALNVSENEIARAYKISGSNIEPIAFIVPRKADSFQSDIFPPAPSPEPSVTAGEFFTGKDFTPKVISLENGAIFAGQAASAPAPAPAKSTSAPAPSKAASTPTPTSAPSPAPAPAPAASAPAPTPVRTSSVNVSSPEIESPAPATGLGSDNSAALREENARLTSELREAREKIRNLELQVESVRANARKAAALLEG